MLSQLHMSSIVAVVDDGSYRGHVIIHGQKPRNVHRLPVGLQTNLHFPPNYVINSYA